MTVEKRYDSTLEEMWQIKREIAAEFLRLKHTSRASWRNRPTVSDAA